MNTDTDTSVFENHTGYWILVFSFCTGQVSAYSIVLSSTLSYDFLSELFVQMTRSTFWKIIDLECVPTCVHEKKAREKKE